MVQIFHKNPLKCISDRVSLQIQLLKGITGGNIGEAGRDGMLFKVSSSSFNFGHPYTYGQIVMEHLVRDTCVNSGRLKSSSLPSKSFSVKCSSVRDPFIGSKLGQSAMKVTGTDFKPCGYFHLVSFYCITQVIANR